MSLSTVIPLSSYGDNVLKENFLESKTKEKLQTVGIYPSVIPNSMRSIQLVIYNRVVNGVGFRNRNGGIEYFSPQLNDLLFQQSKYNMQCKNLRQRENLRRSLKNLRLPHRKEAEKLLQSEAIHEELSDSGIPMHFTVTLKSPGVLAFPKRKGTKTKECCLFANFLDYLSYQTLLRMSDHPLLVDCDCLVMNNVLTFSTLVLDSEAYERVLCLFPKDDIGATMYMTLRSRRKGCIVDLSKIYDPCSNINEYVINKQVKTYE